MALASTTTWEVRTTGGADHGGGFNASRAGAGTNYSLQDNPELAPTNLYRVAASSLYSDSFVFTAAMVGNLIYIASGTHFTAGWYEITARTDNTHVTLDRDPASEDTSAHKDGVGNVGGAIDHPNTISTKVVAGNTVYILTGSYGEIGANDYVLSTAVSGSESLPISWIGYHDARTTTPIGADRPTFDGGAGVANVILHNYDKNIFKNLIITNGTIGFGGAPTSNPVDGGRYHTVQNCKIHTNTGDGISHSFGSSQGLLRLVDCEISANGSDGIYMASNAPRIYILGCYIHNNTALGINAFQALIATMHSNVIESNGDTGSYTSINNGSGNVGPLIANNVFYNNTGAASDGIYFGGTGPVDVINNISKDNGRYAFNENATNPYVNFDYNCYHGHGTELNAVVAGENDVGDADPSFTNAAGGDFTLAAGSPCLNTGFPQTPMAGATI